MKKFIFSLVLVLCVMSGWAQSRGELVVVMRDGSQQTFYLKDDPKLDFRGSYLRIEFSNSYCDYYFRDIQRYYFKNVATGIDAASRDESIVREGDAIKIKTDKAGVKVTVVNVAGALVASAVTDKQGIAVVSLGPLPQGVYVVNYLENSLKITKQ